MSALVSVPKTILLWPFRFFKRLSLKKKIFSIVLVLLILFVGLPLVSSRFSKPSYVTAKATKSTIVETVSESGEIAVNGRTDIYSPTNGIVEEIYAQNGQIVQTGQELFTIKSSATEQEKSQALATYLAAKSALDTANASIYSLQAQMFSTWDEFKGLSTSDMYENSDGTPKNEQRASAEFHAAEKNWIAAESNFKKQQNVISQAQAALSAANLAYQSTQNAVVKATADGVVSNLAVTTGSSVKANSPTSPQRPLATIANNTTTEVVVSLSENDIAKVQPGQVATLEINAIHDKKYTGFVQRVDTLGTVDQGVIRYNAYIQVSNPDDRLRPGMNVDVEITTKTLPNVLSVPNAAVKPYQGGRAVRIVGKDGQVEYIPVQIGIRGTEKTQILKGLTEGQEVITTLGNDQIKRSGFFGS